MELVQVKIQVLQLRLVASIDNDVLLFNTDAGSVLDLEQLEPCRSWLRLGGELLKRVEQVYGQVSVVYLSAKLGDALEEEKEGKVLQVAELVLGLSKNKLLKDIAGLLQQGRAVIADSKDESEEGLAQLQVTSHHLVY